MTLLWYSRNLSLSLSKKVRFAKNHLPSLRLTICLNHSQRKSGSLITTYPLWNSLSGKVRFAKNHLPSLSLTMFSTHTISLNLSQRKSGSLRTTYPLWVTQYILNSHNQSQSLSKKVRFAKNHLPSLRLTIYSRLTQSLSIRKGQVSRTTIPLIWWTLTISRNL